MTRLRHTSSVTGATNMATLNQIAYLSHLVSGSAVDATNTLCTLEKLVKIQGQNLQINSKIMKITQKEKGLW